jgi:hypothetical protein
MYDMYLVCFAKQLESNCVFPIPTIQFVSIPRNDAALQAAGDKLSKAQVRVFQDVPEANPENPLLDIGRIIIFIDFLSSCFSAKKVLVYPLKSLGARVL